MRQQLDDSPNVISHIDTSGLPSRHNDKQINKCGMSPDLGDQGALTGHCSSLLAEIRRENIQ